MYQADSLLNAIVLFSKLLSSNSYWAGVLVHGPENEDHTGQGQPTNQYESFVPVGHAILDL